MARRTAAADDNVNFLAAGQLTQAAAAGPAFAPGTGSFNLSLRGDFGGATVAVQKSFDGGANWLPLARDTAGNLVAFTGPVTVQASEIEADVLFRLVATGATAPTAIAWRASK